MKNILSIIFILIYSNSFSQTKIETEQWIVSKFDKWKADYSFKDSLNNYWSNIPTSLEVKGCKLIYKETELTTQSISHQEKKTYQLEIGDVVSLFWIKNRFVLKSRKKNIGITRSQSSNGYGDLIAFNFDLESEKDLDSMILKAFNHLKTFCKPSKDEKEPF
jgi:hypothetical protein